LQGSDSVGDPQPKTDCNLLVSLISTRRSWRAPQFSRSCHEPDDGTRIAKIPPRVMTLFSALLKGGQAREYFGQRGRTP